MRYKVLIPICRELVNYIYMCNLMNVNILGVHACWHRVEGLPN